MPVSSLGNDVKYTTNEEINYLMESIEVDYCVDFTGYLQEVYGRSKVMVKGVETELFKCVVSNGFKRITVLIWDVEKMTQLSPEFQTDRIIHFDGCEGQVVPIRKQHHENKLLNYELRVQADTIVEMKYGFHVHSPSSTALIPIIGLLDLAKVSGKFKVQAYIKTVTILARNREGVFGFGTGALTEGKHKVPIKVNAFKKGDADHLSKGLCVLITGIVSRTGRLTVVCQDISCLEVLEDELKLDEDTVNGANMPLKRCSDDEENLNPNAKKLSITF